MKSIKLTAILLSVLLLVSIMLLDGCGVNETNVSNPLNTSMQIVSTTYNTFVIKSDHTLWAWGSNWFGCLGDGTGQDKNVPTQIGSDTNWALISASGKHTVAIKTDGTLWAWGDNEYGQLGDGTSGYLNDGKTTNRTLVPEKIGTDTDWIAVAAGSVNTVALKKDRSLWTWGGNANGQLGDGNYRDEYNSNKYDKHVPTRVGTDNDWIKIASTGDYTLAIKKDGTLWSWGYNQAQNLGYTTKYDYSPVPAKIGTDADWVGIFATGPGAIKKNGSLWLWGELAHGISTDESTWLQMIQVPGNWTTVSIGGPGPAGFALDAGSKWWGWGPGNLLGRGTVVTAKDVIPPTKPVQISGDWAELVMGQGCAFGSKNASTIWAWGLNANGQLGIGYDSNKGTNYVDVPTQVYLK